MKDKISGWHYTGTFRGAHYDRETTFITVEQYIMKAFNELKDLSKKI
jgi:hypothetical protein